MVWYFAQRLRVDRSRMDLKTLLRDVDNASLCDADKTLRVLDPGIRSVNGRTDFAGEAYTVTCRDDFLAVIQGLHQSAAGHVLIIDADGGTRAVAGELFASEAVRRGLVAIVIDGACRDTHKLIDIPLPVYARHVSPMAGSTARLRETDLPVTCGGVQVRPRDIVIGDADGIVVVDPKALPDLAARAKRIQSSEAAILQGISDGKSLFTMINFDDHSEKIRSGEDTTLRFLV